ncbi:MAG TPA: hypothetical protein VFA68_03580 [Terriglobales bacterium]|nr:hypothetical protein [Terriglobales bacterium]
MTLNLSQWREQYVNAARANELPTLRFLISELGAYLRECRCSVATPSVVNSAASWQELCALAEKEKDPEKLMALVARINELLSRREGPRGR